MTHLIFTIRSVAFCRRFGVCSNSWIFTSNVSFEQISKQKYQKKRWRNGKHWQKKITIKLFVSLKKKHLLYELNVFGSCISIYHLIAWDCFQFLRIIRWENIDYLNTHWNYYIIEQRKMFALIGQCISWNDKCLSTKNREMKKKSNEIIS